MKTISLCMIMKNEEDTIGNCLESILNIFDEIIIVDTGSNDKSKEVASKYTNKIYDFKWVDDFSKARNFAFSLATSDYIMWLDADDILLPKDKLELEKIKKELDGIKKQIVAKYNVGFDENGNVNFTYNRERIFLRSQKYTWIGAIHEVIPIDSDAIYANFAVTHNKKHPTEKGRNLRIYQKMMKEKTIFSSRDKFYYARELYYNSYFKKAISAFKKFLLCQDGWFEDKKVACYLLSKCYKELHDFQKCQNSLFNALNYGVPSGELCCEIAKNFAFQNKLQEAIFWYETALSLEPKLNTNTFLELDYYKYIPAIELCVCFDKLGSKLVSMLYNEVAGYYKKTEAISYNRNYFNSLY